MRSINQELKEEVSYKIEHSPLPRWIIPVITQIAYTNGHAYGEDEVNGYIIDWLDTFEEAYKKEIVNGKS